jgi:hypothetical protein
MTLQVYTVVFVSFLEYFTVHTVFAVVYRTQRKIPKDQYGPLCLSADGRWKAVVS